jgi:hypothetical protein
MSTKVITVSGVIFTPNASLNVYSDAACTVPMPPLVWANLEPGGSATAKIYVKNLGNVPLKLNAVNSAWVPTNAGTFIHQTWDKENAILAAGANVLATLTLTVDANITGITNYNYSTSINGTRSA